MVATTVTRKVPVTSEHNVVVRTPRYVSVDAGPGTGLGACDLGGSSVGASASAAGAGSCGSNGCGIGNVIADGSRPRPVRDFLSRLFGSRLCTNPCAAPVASCEPSCATSASGCALPATTTVVGAAPATLPAITTTAPAATPKVMPKPE